MSGASELPFKCGEFHCMWTKFNDLDFKKDNEMVRVLLVNFRRNIRELMIKCDEYSKENIQIFEHLLTDISKVPMDRRYSGEYPNIKRSSKNLRKTGSHKKVKQSNNIVLDLQLDYAQTVNTKKPRDIIVTFYYILKTGRMLLDFKRRNFGSKTRYKTIITGIVGGIGLTTAFVGIIVDAFTSSENSTRILNENLDKLCSMWRGYIKKEFLIQDISKCFDSIKNDVMDDNFIERFEMQMRERITRMGFDDVNFVKEFCEDSINKLRKITKEVSRQPSFVQRPKKKRIFFPNIISK